MAFIKKPQNQEIFFDNKTRRMVDNVVKIEQGTWWHVVTADGTEYIINPDRVLFIRNTHVESVNDNLR